MKKIFTFIILALLVVTAGCQKNVPPQEQVKTGEQQPPAPEAPVAPDPAQELEQEIQALTKEQAITLAKQLLQPLDYFYENSQPHQEGYMYPPPGLDTVEKIEMHFAATMKSELAKTLAQDIVMKENEIIDNGSEKLILTPTERIPTTSDVEAKDIDLEKKKDGFSLVLKLQGIGDITYTFSKINGDWMLAEIG